MTVRTRLVNPEQTHIFIGTITDRADVHQSIANMARANDITTATLELLHRAEFTAYDFVQQKRFEPIIFERAMEIVAGQGTISLLDDDLPRQQKQWLAHALFVVNLSAIIILQGLERAAEQSESLPWIEQIVNTIAQTGFVYAVCLLSKSTLAILKGGSTLANKPAA